MSVYLCDRCDCFRDSDNDPMTHDEEFGYLCTKCANLLAEVDARYDDTQPEDPNDAYDRAMGII